MHGFDLSDAVKKRYSVRTYLKKPLSEEHKELLLSYAEKIKNPLGPKIRLQLVDRATASNGERLGTYGIIKGAANFFAVTVENTEMAMEALGYEFEQLVLYAASLGLGTCWLGGTFNRSAFASAIEIKEGELFPILSPIGYPADKKSFTERLMRGTIKADQRLAWDKLYFKGGFDNPLSQQDSGEYSFPLEMLRLAPSAVNGQPWRVLVDDKGVHFFKKQSAVSGHGDTDMQRIDMGIAMCHFDLAMQEQGIKGGFEKLPVSVEVPAELKYVTSWKKI